MTSAADTTSLSTLPSRCLILCYKCLSVSLCPCQLPVRVG